MVGIRAVCVAETPYWSIRKSSIHIDLSTVWYILSSCHLFGFDQRSLIALSAVTSVYL